MRLAAPVLVSLSIAMLAGLPLAGCGDSKEGAYKPKPPASGKAANLPSVPTLPQKPKKVGDSYTVWGLIHDMRSRVHSAEVLEKEVTVTGYIVKTNLPDAPACAIHKTGKKDGKECEATPPPIPTFWIADEKGTAEKDAVQVMGFARNFAVLYDALEKYKRPNNKDVVKDDVWGVDVPSPLPSKDAKVKLVGTYSTSFTKAAQGAESNPMTGIIAFKTMQYLEPAPEPGTLAGVK
jgi:hypothetical protein